MKTGLLLALFTGLLVINIADSETCSTSGAVRLLWGAGPWEGNVQICLNGVWGWICQNSFYTNEAKVVCRQLGFNATGAIWRRYAYYGWPDPSAPIWLDQLGCHGTESNIMSCPRPKAIGDASCNHNALAAVLCPNSASSSTCTEGALRLLRNQASTPFKSNGRVEICHNNKWGSICDSGWGTPDARVACGQLGYSSTSAASYCCGIFGQSYGPVWLSNLGCSGSNGKLSSCSHTSYGSTNCNHTKDAGAGCRGEITTACTNGDVKLYRPYNTGPPNDGLALYCNNSRWVGFCDDGWSCHNARLICKKLGYPAALNTRYEGYYGYYKQTDHYRFYCRSTNTELSQCSYTYRSSCTSLNDQIGVICYKPVPGTACTNGQVRLQNGNTTSEGRVEYCYEGKWNPLCSIDGITASLICKQLGFNSTLATIVDDQRFNRTNMRSVLNSLSCSATTPSLGQCNTTMKGSACFTSVSKCSTEVGLRCHNTAYSTCTDGQSRLVNGTLAQEGRVEVCLSGIWGSVCQSRFDQSDAYVICKELGYNGPSPNVYYHSKYGESSGPIVYSNLKCKGWEDVLTECIKDTFPNVQCSPQNTVGLICKDDCTDGDVRLVGGGFTNEGTVEVCMSHMWGLVSDAGWNASHAKVVCRQLGYTGGIYKPFTGSAFGKPSNRILLKNVKCSGNELKLIDCSSKQLSLWAGRKQLPTTSVAGVDCIYDEPTDPPCGTKPASYDNTQGTDCTQGSVRLQGGSASSGRLEYCYNGYWSPVCKLDPVTAMVACKDLGYTTYSWGTIVETGEFGNRMNISLFDNITCSGSENHISECQLSNSNPSCTPVCSKNLGLRCFNKGVCSTEGAVRLADGIIDNEGRVEVCVNGVWGAVCDQGWSKTDANIICKQLGLPDTEPVVLPNSEFGDGLYPVIYSNVTCGGWETSITQCNKMTYPNTACSRRHIAGVLCGYDCSDGDVRLDNKLSNNNYEGTVEVCYENLWGLVADTNWNQQDAVVVCRQLGFETSGTQSVTGSHFGKPNLRLHMTNVACDGTEDSIGQCSYDTYSLSDGKTQLATTNVAGVKCYIPANCVAPPSSGTACADGNVKLVGGKTNSEGIIQYCFRGNWSPFCYLGPNEATVACRQLGHTSYEMTAVFTDGRFGSMAGVSLFQNISCADNLASNQLGDCLIADSCQSTCTNVVGLRCYDAANCKEGAVRLVDGPSTTEGRLEVCYKGVWGSVCGTGFDVTDAYVACKELGLGISEPTVYTNSHYGDGDGAIVYYNTSCRGYESSISGCSKQTYGSFTCSRSNVAGVACQEGCTNGAVRIINGSSSAEGTVEVCYYNTWGLVADGGWGSEEAQVVCHQLYYPGGSPLSGSPFGRPNAPILISNTQCTGTETTLNSCQYTQLSEDESNNLYANAPVAGVRCNGVPVTPSHSSSSSHKLSSSSIGLTVLSLLLVAFIALSAGLIAFIIYRMKKGSTKRYSPVVHLSTDTQDAPNPTATANMWPRGDKDDDDEDDDEMIQLINE